MVEHPPIQAPDAAVPIIIHRALPHLDWEPGMVGSTHDWTEIVWITHGWYRGACRSTQPHDGEAELTYELRPGAILYLPAGTVHRGEQERGQSGTVVLKHFDRQPAGPHPIVLKQADPRLHGLLLWLLDLADAPDWPGALALDLGRTLLQAIADCAAGTSRPATTPEAIVAEYLHDNYYEAITLEDLVAIAGISTTHLLRRFRAAYGRSPIRYLQELRAAAACDLLLTTRLPLAAIARRVGLRSRSYLSRLVLETTGRMPRDWRSRG